VSFLVFFLISKVANVLNFSFCVVSMKISAVEVALSRAQRSHMVAPENSAGGSRNAAEVGGTENATEASNVQASSIVVKLATSAASSSSGYVKIVENEAVP
jgi:hypothetical protein